MTVAFDAFTPALNIGSGAFTGDITATQWVHTPVGTPRGVLFLCGQNTAADQIISASYGGVALTELGVSPLLGTGVETMTCYAYFLGSGIPTGAQDVLVDTSSSAAKNGVIITLTGASDLTVDATATLDTTMTNPSFSLSTTPSTTTFVAAVLASGVDAAVNITPGASYTQILAQAQAGARVMSMIRATTNPTGGSVTVNWTAAASEEAVAIAVAVKESAPAPPPARKLMVNVSPRRW